MKEKDIQKRERNAVILILLFCVIIILCSAGLFLCYAKERIKGIYYEPSDGMWTVVPGGTAAAHFGFTMELPETGNRRYALVMDGVTFDGGGLGFADMNEGQWEYSVAGGIWQPLVLTNGECVLEKEALPGKRRLLIRASDNLDINAAGGSLNFELKLKEIPDGRMRIWLPLGVAAGGLTITLMFYIIKKIERRKKKCFTQNL